MTTMIYYPAFPILSALSFAYLQRHHIPCYGFMESASASLTQTSSGLSAGSLDMEVRMRL
jgi:hypothetical protein